MTSRRVSVAGRLVQTAVLALVVAPVAIFVAAGPAPEPLTVNPQGVAEGQWWRLITGHLVHSDASHLAWNACALVALLFLLPRTELKDALAVFLASSAALGAYLLYSLPAGSQYCGLSGFLNALVVVAVYALWRQGMTLSAAAFASLWAIKTLLDLAAGGSVFVVTEWQALPEVHVVGLAVGLAWVMLRAFGGGTPPHPGDPFHG